MDIRRKHRSDCALVYVICMSRFVNSSVLRELGQIAGSAKCMRGRGWPGYVIRQYSTCAMPTMILHCSLYFKFTCTSFVAPQKSLCRGSIVTNSWTRHQLWSFSPPVSTWTNLLHHWGHLLAACQRRGSNRELVEAGAISTAVTALEAKTIQRWRKTCELHCIVESASHRRWQTTPPPPPTYKLDRSANLKLWIGQWPISLHQAVLTPLDGLVVVWSISGKFSYEDFEEAFRLLCYTTSLLPRTFSSKRRNQHQNHMSTVNPEYFVYILFSYNSWLSYENKVHTKRSARQRVRTGHDQWL